MTTCPKCNTRPHTISRGDYHRHNCRNHLCSQGTWRELGTRHPIFDTKEPFTIRAQDATPAKPTLYTYAAIHSLAAECGIPLKKVVKEGIGVSISVGDGFRASRLSGFKERLNVLMPMGVQYFVLTPGSGAEEPTIEPWLPFEALQCADYHHIHNEGCSSGEYNALCYKFTNGKEQLIWAHRRRHVGILTWHSYLKKNVELAHGGWLDAVGRNMKCEPRVPSESDAIYRGALLDTLSRRKSGPQTYSKLSVKLGGMELTEAKDLTFSDREDPAVIVEPKFKVGDWVEFTEDGTAGRVIGPANAEALLVRVEGIRSDILWHERDIRPRPFRIGDVVNVKTMPTTYTVDRIYGGDVCGQDMRGERYTYAPDYLTLLEPASVKPAEPKFKAGDMVRVPFVTRPLALSHKSKVMDEWIGIDSGGNNSHYGLQEDEMTLLEPAESSMPPFEKGDLCVSEDDTMYSWYAGLMVKLKPIRVCMRCSSRNGVHEPMVRLTSGLTCVECCK